MHTSFIPTDAGVFVARFSDSGLATLSFPGRQPVDALESAVESVPVHVQKWMKLTADAVRSIIGGKSPREMPPFDIRVGTKFQQSVWKAMSRIPFGETQSYGEIARSLGKPGATRAVGGACGANPIPVLIPCHRVLAAHGKIGGFSGGLDWKRRLLTCEGRVPESLFEAALSGTKIARGTPAPSPALRLRGG